ncbi:MAG: RluA family pseudouridine synthase [Clostridia bacterium]|jgi:23S rRNA pseudouridine1911/1915/1917 synthase|nr:RluA family pseudouridine synthase [Clostridia bacterium]
MDKMMFTIEEQQIGKRLDAFLSEQIEGQSRSYIQKLIEQEAVLIKGKPTKSNYKLRAGDHVEVSIPDAVPLDVVAEDIELNIVYEDEDVIVLNKPQGMVVHPAHGNYTGTIVNALLSHCDNLSGINGVMRPGIVHRIDKDTSGIIIIAKNNEAHVSLSEQLKEHSITRRYIALVEGIVKTDMGTIDTMIGRNPKNRKEMAIVSKNGKRAITHYTVLEKFENYTLIEARLETGRTHQIRVHMAHIGHPIVGDPVYGYKKQKFHTEGQLLHAKVLGFIHPRTGEYKEFEAPLPDYFVSILNKIRK